MTNAARSYLTTFAIAGLAFITACVAHEAVGHGGMCLTLGGRVRLLSSVYFRSPDAGPLVDAAGPLMNIALGLALVAVLQRAKRLREDWRMFLSLTMSLNLFWGFGYLLFTALTERGDWAFLLNSAAPAWRIVMGVTGIVLYLATMKIARPFLPRAMFLFVSYLSIGVVALAVTSLYAHGPVAPALKDAVLESLGVGFGWLWMALAQLRRAENAEPPLGFRPRWIITFAVAAIIFAATMGRGMVW